MLPLLRVRVFFFWCLLAVSFSLGTDGMLLALCDHGFERSGQCAEIIIIIIILHIESSLDRLGLLSPTHDHRSQQKIGQIRSNQF